MPVTITGTLVLPSGAVADSRIITLRRTGSGVSAQSGVVIMPDVVTVQSNAQGSVSFELLPGNYRGFTRGADGSSESFSLAVPDVASADIAALVDAEPVPAAPPAWYAELLARIEVLEDGGVTQPEISTVDAATNITANTLITGAA